MKKNKKQISKVFSEMGKRSQKKITLAERVRRAKKGWKSVLPEDRGKRAKQGWKTRRKNAK